MKTKLPVLFIGALILFSSCMGFLSSPEKTIVAEGPPPALIPLPQTLDWKENLYRIPEKNIICINEGGENAAGWLQELLEKSNVRHQISFGNDCGNWIINTDPKLQEQLGDEGYILNITSTGITLKGATEMGLFNGIQTLRQFFPSEIENNQLSNDILLRQVRILDKPQYSWRGSMVDIARSFFGLEYLKSHVDRMALYKLNRLHLHLTDDQGWRIEIKGKPKLTEIGSKGSVKGGNLGFLTQEEYMELQDYALARNIIIIPEIDMPGHIYSALVSYPELNCNENSNIEPKLATPPDLYQGYEVGWSRFCLKKPETYQFVSDVIRELAETTKGPWIHIGGDEIEDPLYETFVVKADSIVQSYGKTSIGWEEVTKAEVSPGLISQEWAGNTESIVDVKVIQSICTNFYLDHANIPGQPNTLNWCKEDGVSIEDAYSFKSENPSVIGVEAPVWTEHVLNDEMLDDRFWPRLIAVAEVGWTSNDLRNFANFKDRLKGHGSRLGNMGIHYFPTPEIEWGKRNIAEEPTSVFSNYRPEVK